MAFIETVSPDRASGDVRAMSERYQAAQSYVPNAIKGVQRYELITLAAARALRSSYCMLAHGAVLTRDFYSTEQLTAIAAVRCFFSKPTDALGAEPDSAYEGVGADLKRALTPGRRISVEPVERLT